MPEIRPEDHRTNGFLPAMILFALVIGVLVVTATGGWH